METIRVNMTPCEDVQTIHASQNDNEAREWGFELHNNGEKIDSSSISDQMVFKAYKGGTEEILPTNGSTPTTSPFKGDIKYPQGLLSDQEFLYRESPTEEDGLAKIKKLYGNTLVWNQLVQNGNFADTSIWQNYGSTFTVSGNTATVKTTNASNQFGIYQPITFKANHKYFVSFEVKKHGTIILKRNRLSSGQEQIQEGSYRTIETASADSTISSPIRILFGEPVSDIANDYFMVKNYMIIDLTQMGLDSITDPSDFTSLFSKSYYDYCQGAMLSFGGRNVKFNQLVRNGNFVDTSYWNSGGTKTVSNNELTYTKPARWNALSNSQLINLVSGHKYLAMFEAYCENDIMAIFWSTGTGQSTAVYTMQSGTSWAKYSLILTSTQTTASGRVPSFDNNSANETIFHLRNYTFVDLTEMFGAGNEPSTSGFKELFPNDYYEYNVGQYMNLGQPVSLKTVSKNQFNVNDVIADAYVTLEKNKGNIHIVYDGTNAQRYRGFYMYRTEPYVNGHFLPKQYTVSFDVVGIDTTWVFGLRGVSNNTFDAYQRVTFNADGHYSFTFNPSELAEDYYLSASRTGNKTTAFDITFSNIQIEIGTETEYEPFEESTLSIPLDEFPNGMDGINDVWDEKNETGYVKRIGQVDLGSLTWTRNTTQTSGVYRFISSALPSDVKLPANNDTVANIFASNFAIDTTNHVYQGVANNMSISLSAQGTLQARADEFTDATAFKDSLSDAYLYYELSTPLENYGVVDLGTLNWAVSQGVTPLRFEATMPSGYKKPATSAERNRLICSKYSAKLSVTASNNETGITNYQNSNYIYIRDLSYSDVATFKNSLQGVYLLYEKENSQGFTTATLVTENGEVALANENGVLVGKCNSDVSANAGFIEGKIKLSDEDGDVYSNKIQLHIERSPQ